ncbi:MAG: hypothetical protein IJ087_06870 [Eggerthellaceae bacterium]|nr:hypothetical protein [Eggerthellaceae bacterium]
MHKHWRRLSVISSPASCGHASPLVKGFSFLIAVNLVVMLVVALGPEVALAENGGNSSYLEVASVTEQESPSNKKVDIQASGMSKALKKKVKTVYKKALKPYRKAYRYNKSWYAISKISGCGYPVLLVQEHNGSGSVEGDRCHVYQYVAGKKNAAYRGYFWMQGGQIYRYKNLYHYLVYSLNGSNRYLCLVVDASIGQYRFAEYSGLPIGSKVVKMHPVTSYSHLSKKLK